MKAKKTHAHTHTQTHTRAECSEVKWKGGMEGTTADDHLDTHAQGSAAIVSEAHERR